MLYVCFVVVECKGKAKDVSVAVVSYASMSSFNNNSSSFNPSHPHVLPSHHTHLTTLTLSRRQGRLPLVLASSAKAKNQHKNQGGEKKGLHSLIKGSVGHRNVHIRGCCYTYGSINSAERVHLEPQDHHHRRCPA